MIHCVFDKELNQLLLNRKNIFKSYQEEQMLNLIKQVEVTEDTEDGYTISLVLVKGDKIDLQTQKSKGNYDEIAQSINQFLNAKY